MVKYCKTINGTFEDLGEEQFDYDKLLALDETLDSCKVLVNSTLEDALKPATFILLDNEYWYLENDKSEKNTDGTYTHTLQLSELTQILNDIFIQDCSFYQGRYTYMSGLDRLFKINGLYDKGIYFNSSDDTINYNKQFPYFRFEGYSLFNALREIYQSVDRFPRVKETFGKLFVYFDTLDGENRETINLDELTNNGNINLDQYKERGRDKNANVVIQNAYNVKAFDMYFPNKNFGTNLVPENYSADIDTTNAVLELPYKVDKVENITLFPKISVYQYYHQTGYKKGLYAGWYYPELIEDLQSKVDNEDAKKAIENLSYIFKETIYDSKNLNSFLLGGDRTLVEKKKYDLLKRNYVFDKFKIDDKEKAIYWTQYDNKIRHFYYDKSISKYYHTKEELYKGTTTDANYESIEVEYDLRPANLKVSCQFTPLANLKLVYENNNYDNDIINAQKKANQVGKIIDFNNVANFTKNYILQMQEEDTILNALYIKKEDILPIGANAIYNGNKYVVTKISITNHNNENYSCIYQLNENIIRRSEFVKADSDIINYNIPIDETLDRSVTYKTTCYLTATREEKEYIGNELNYNSQQYFNFFHYTTNWSEQKYALMKITYDYNGDDEYSKYRYYVLPTALIYDSKTKTIVYNISFLDNSLIGFSNKVKYTLWNIVKMGSSYSTPIRYTDENGEFKGIEIKWTNHFIDTEPIFEFENKTLNTMEYWYWEDIFPLLEYVDDEDKRQHYYLGNYFLTDDNFYKDAFEIPNIAKIVQYKNSNSVKIFIDDFLPHTRFMYGGTNTKRFCYAYSEDDLPHSNPINPIEFNTDMSDFYIDSEMLKIVLKEKIDYNRYNIGIYSIDKYESIRLMFQINKGYLKDETGNIQLYLNTYLQKI